MWQMKRHVQGLISGAERSGVCQELIFSSGVSELVSWGWYEMSGVGLDSRVYCLGVSLGRG